MRWGHVARMAGMRNVYKILVGKPKGKRPLRTPWCRWVDNMWVVKCGLDSSGPRQNPVAGSDEHGYETSCSIEGGEFLDQLSDS